MVLSTVNRNTNNLRISSLLFVPIVAILIAGIEMFLPRSVPTPSIFYPCTTTSNAQSQDTSSPPTIVLIPGLDGAATLLDATTYDHIDLS